MPDSIPPSAAVLSEALHLSGEIVRNLELSEIPLANVALKASRLARLLNDDSWQKVFEYEAGGYPRNHTGVPTEAYNLALAAGRICSGFNERGQMVHNMVYTDSIGALEATIRTQEVALESARDPSISIHSANPLQIVSAPLGNSTERFGIKKAITDASVRLESRRTLVYRYALAKLNELKYSAIAGDSFARVRERVDAQIGATIPDAVRKFTAVYDNLRSDNPEDWANAVHGCRRILQALADALFPATQQLRSVIRDGRRTEVKLGADQYVNRLIAFIEDRSHSHRFREIVGSHLSFVGERLDAVFQAAQKGSHAEIVSREEADRYVVYTYMLIGDILSLLERGTSPQEGEQPGR